MVIGENKMKKFQWLMILLVVFWYVEGYDKIEDLTKRLNVIANQDFNNGCMLDETSIKIVPVISNYIKYYLVYELYNQKDTEEKGAYDDPFQVYFEGMPKVIKSKKSQIIYSSINTTSSATANPVTVSGK